MGLHRESSFLLVSYDVASFYSERPDYSSTELYEEEECSPEFFHLASF